MYVWYGTNEYSFEKLENPPTFEPILYSECGKVIYMGTDGFSQLGEKIHMREMQRKGDAQDIAPKNWIQIILKPNWLHKPARPLLWEYKLVMRS